jgi:methyl-accepting chemotaxis protein
MEALFWAALGFLVVAALGGAVFVGIRGWRFWQAFVSLAAGVGGGTDRLLTGAEQLAAHGERTAARVEDLTAAIERLAQAQAQARILLGATGEVRDLLRAVTAFAPQK